MCVFWELKIYASDIQLNTSISDQAYNPLNLLKMILSVESEKDVIHLQRCFIENQKGAIAVQSPRW